MSLLFSNPEIVRNARIQLRPGRMIAAAVICAAVSATTWATIMRSDVDLNVDGLHGAGAVFVFILYIQIAVLLIGGGFYCLQSVHREKELNTFDYQRVTRLTSLELAVGKLLGAPILAYFAVLGLMPVALIGAIRGGVPFGIILETYFLLVLGTITYHALALLVSTLLGRGGLAVSIFLFLVLVGMSSIDFYSAATPSNVPFLRLHSLSPFALGSLIAKPPSMVIAVFAGPARFAPADVWSDIFLGKTISHSLVLIALYVTFTCWFMLAITRNLKRDPSIYEVYTPGQAFLFTLYVNLLVLGFFNWTGVFQEKSFFFNGQSYYVPAARPTDVERQLFTATLWLFVILALVLLRNRERVRRRVRQFGSAAAGWWAALWPAPYLIGGIAVFGGAVIGLISHYRNPGDWDVRLAVYDAAFLAIWIARDALYFQWMNLRRGKRPLASAALYLAIFYVCTSTVFSALHFYRDAQSTALTAIVLPWPAFFVDSYMFGSETRLFIGALVLQALEALVFVWLQRMKLREFLASPPAAALRVEQVAEQA